MTEPQPTTEAQHRNMFVLRALVVFGFAFLLLAVAPHAAQALDLGDPVGTVTDTPRSGDRHPRARDRHP